MVYLFYYVFILYYIVVLIKGFMYVIMLIMIGIFFWLWFMGCKFFKSN